MDLLETTRRLSDLSIRHQRGAGTGDWPESVTRPAWFTSPELVSLHGTAHWEALDEAQRQELSFWEAVNFFSLNIHGERSLIEGLAYRLYRPGLTEVTEYLHHFLGEENTHSVWFGTFCLRYGGKVYPERKVSFPADQPDAVADFLFFARVLLFEEVVDCYNTAMADDASLDPLARRINADHHADETRHLVFGRQLVAHLWQEHRPAWSEETVAGVRRHLADYLATMWRDYYNPSVYLDAGLAEPWALAREVWASPAAVSHRAAQSRPGLAAFLAAGILETEPVT